MAVNLEQELQDAKAMIIGLNGLIKVLGGTLKKASDHLDFCGYGDAYEREAARDLEMEIEKAIDEYEEYYK